MKAQKYFFKITFIMLICIVSAFFTLINFFPSSSFKGWRFNLGLDLKGGSDILLEINFDEYLKERIFFLKDSVARDLRKAKIGYMNLNSDAAAIYFELRNAEDKKRASSAITKAGNFFTFDYMENNKFRIYLTKEAISEMRQNVKKQTIEILRKRIDEKGNKEILLQAGSENRILLQIPGVYSSESIKSLLNVTAKLTFHLMDETAPYLSSKVNLSLKDSRVLEPYNKRENIFYVVKNKIEIEGSSLINANAVVNRSEPAVSFELDNAGARRFAEITRNYVGKPFAIVLDDKVLSAPSIREPIIGGAGMISGGFTLLEAKELALLLRSGALPTSLKVIEERVIGPSLGAESIRAGAKASIVGIILVFSFMMLRYKIFGVFASISLLINLMLILTGLSILGSTLTLPGIAGIVLTVGMSVDANVLIFEKIREIRSTFIGEYTKKQFLKSIEEGFASSFSTILDSNLTTIATAIVLYLVGFGPIKGFAVTLILGILTSMFSSIILTSAMIKMFTNIKRYSPRFQI